jgi:hypothetical protein
MLHLTDKKSAAKEPTIKDNPLSHSNLKEILQRIMQEGSEMWDNITMLNCYKELMKQAGFEPGGTWLLCSG